MNLKLKNNSSRSLTLVHTFSLPKTNIKVRRSVFLSSLSGSLLTAFSLSPISIPRPAGWQEVSRKRAKFPLRESERERKRDGEREWERGNGKRRNFLQTGSGGGLPFASATVFSTSAADYKQKKEKKALPSVNNRKCTKEETQRQRGV